MKFTSVTYEVYICNLVFTDVNCWGVRKPLPPLSITGVFPPRVFKRNPSVFRVARPFAHLRPVRPRSFVAAACPSSVAHALAPAPFGLIPRPRPLGAQALPTLIPPPAPPQGGGSNTTVLALFRPSRGLSSPLPTFSLSAPCFRPSARKFLYMAQHLV